MSLDSLCRWQVQVSVYCAWRIPAHLRCTQCSILLHLMDICFLSYMCLWQISQIQTFLVRVVGPGLVSTSPAFVSNSASHPADPHGRHAQKTVDRAPIAVMTSSHLFFFSSFIVSINVFPVSRVPSAKGLLEYCFLYASYRLCDSSVRPTLPWYVSSGHHTYKTYESIVVFWDRFNFFDGFIKIR